ncbi:hypothetical protein ABPG74_011099 [Tetrahymena malaccensis]
MNPKQAVNSVAGIICFAVLLLLFWWSHHHRPHDKPYQPPAVSNRWTVYNHEVCRNACPVAECTTEDCVNAFNAFDKYSENDSNCSGFWSWFETAQADDVLPDSFYYCGHGKNNEWQKNAESNSQYLQIWQCNWGPSCSEQQ